MTVFCKKNVMSKRGVFGAAIAMSLFIVGAENSAFAAWPEKALTIVVPFSAGGSTDILARMLAKPMQNYLGQTVLIENRVGAAGAVGAAAVAKAAPDGYTILFGGVGTNIVVPLTVPETTYNPQRDLAPAGQVCTVDYVLVVKADSAIKSVDDLVKIAKQKSGAVSYMSTGNKGPLHLGMAYFSKLADIELNHIPYKGEAAAMPDLVSGRVDVAMMTVPYTIPMISDGKIRAIASIAPTRSALMPEIKTIAEMGGYQDFQLPIWIGLSVPAGTPADRIELINQAMRIALKDDEVKQSMLRLGVSPVGSTPAEFGAFQEKERKRWSTMIKETGLLDN